MGTRRECSDKSQVQDATRQPKHHHASLGRFPRPCYWLPLRWKDKLRVTEGMGSILGSPGASPVGRCLFWSPVHSYARQVSRWKTLLWPPGGPASSITLATSCCRAQQFPLQRRNLLTSPFNCPACFVSPGRLIRAYSQQRGSADHGAEIFSLDPRQSVDSCLFGPSSC